MTITKLRRMRRHTRQLETSMLSLQAENKRLKEGAPILPLEPEPKAVLPTADSAALAEAMQAYIDDYERLNEAGMPIVDVLDTLRRHAQMYKKRLEETGAK